MTTPPQTTPPVLGLIFRGAIPDDVIEMLGTATTKAYRVGFMSGYASAFVQAWSSLAKEKEVPREVLDVAFEQCQRINDSMDTYWNSGPAPELADHERFCLYVVHRDPLIAVRTVDKVG